MDGQTLFTELKTILAGLYVEPADAPRLDALPPGCRFAPRCPRAFDRCHQIPPPLYALGNFHLTSCFLVDPKNTR